MTAIAPPFAPLRLTVHAATIDCPAAGERPPIDCDGCRYLQGTLLDSDPIVLCGYLELRLAIVRPLNYGPMSGERIRHEQPRTLAIDRTANCAAPKPSASPTTTARAAVDAGVTDDGLIFFSDWPFD
jgi:hypothetical protein